MIHMKSYLMIIIVIVFMRPGETALANQFCMNQICQDCYYRCKTCFGQTEKKCLSCFGNYLLIDGSCLGCGSNCISCVQDTGLCETCANNFYLSQSTNKCQSCPKGAQTCTFSSIQQCQSGYYLKNSMCFPCLQNCISCTEASSCSLCNNSYYLSTICQPCKIEKCSSCPTTSTICELCQDGTYGSLCQNKCPSFCKICSGQTCYQCMNHYYLDGNGLCSPLGLLCEEGRSIDECERCREDVAAMWQGSCYPYPEVHLMNRQEYYRPFNQRERFRGQLMNCQRFIYAEGKEDLDIVMDYWPSYLLKVKIQVLARQNETKNIKISSNNTEQIHSHTLSTQKSHTCGPNNLIINNLQLHFTPSKGTSHSNTTFLLQLSSNQKGYIGVSEVLVQYHVCQVQQCIQCLTAYTCSSCASGYYIENNVCVKTCTFGYYLTIESKTCTLACRDRYFPILEDYRCQSCTSPCQTCSSANRCKSCLVGWFLLIEQCLSLCPQGFYKNHLTNECSSCRFPCKTCEVDRETCTSCLVGYLNRQYNNCTIKCSQHFYSNFMTFECLACSLSCRQCELLPDKCLSCSTGMFLNQNNTCLSTCQPGYLQNILLNICQKCIYPCKNCINTSSQCLQCFQGYFLNHSCLKICPSFYYQDNTLRRCLPCENNCKICLSKLQCVSCQKGFYYSGMNRSCNAMCEVGTYEERQECVGCESPCRTCMNKTYCLSCQDYRFAFFMGKCLLTCPDSTFITYQIETKIKMCSPCSQNCMTCISLTGCLQCNNISVLHNGLCLPTCPNSTYLSHKTCKTCIPPCKQCQTNDKCLSCSNTTLYLDKTYSCVSSCPDNYVNISSLCKQCNYQCETCKGSTYNCIECKQGYYKQPNGTCLQVCQSGYFKYSIQKLCKKCSSKCKTCLSEYRCMSCITDGESLNRYLWRYGCLMSCPDGYYSNEEEGFICLSCSQQCKTCFKEKDNCTKCQHERYLSPLTNKCQPTCPEGYFQNQGSQCAPCVSNCKICLSLKQCEECVSHAFVLQGGQCLSLCLFGSFSIEENSNSKVCFKCGSQCLECYGEEGNCTSCRSGQSLSPLSMNQSNRECLRQCPEYYYQDVLNQECLACVHPCQLCITKKHCLSCGDNFYLQFDSCITKCLDGYFQSNKKCILCQFPCRTCNSSSSITTTLTVRCLSCMIDYFYEESSSKCLSECSNRTYSYKMSNGELQCISCSSLCETCHDSSACKSCHLQSQRPYLQGTACQSKCTDGYYSNNQSFRCRECSWGCISCFNFQNCTKCLSSYLYKGLCLIQCPSQFYSTLNFICEPCYPPCQTCFNPINCQSCIQGYYLYQTYCLEQCPQDNWHIQSKRTCNKTCISPYFKIQDQMECVLSCDKYYDENRQCKDRCDQGEMANETLGCEACGTAACQSYLRFQVNILQIDGQIVLLLIFNLPLDDPNAFRLDILQLKISEIIIHQQELDLNGLRVLKQQKNIMNNLFLEIIQAKKYYIKIKINLKQQINYPIMGKININIKNLSVLTTNKYPLQHNQIDYDLDWYHTNQKTHFTYYLGIFASFLLLSLLLINVILNRTQQMILAIDGMINLHILFYLQFWNHPVIQNYLKGLRYLALRQSVFHMGQGNLWGCSVKYITLYGQCNLYSQLLLPIIFIIILVVIIIVSKYIPFLQKKHEKMIGHLGILWWMSSGLGISSFRGIIYSKTIIQTVISIIIASLYMLVFIILAYTIIKNVFSLSFQDRFFFWNLKKRKTEQQLSNLNHFMIIIRRIVLVTAVGFNEQKPLSCLFIITLLTICIISNIIINHPFKRHNLLFGISEGLFAGILVLEQMYVVNAAKIGTSAWNFYGISLFVVIVVYSVGILSMACFQTGRCVIKVYRSRQREDLRRQEEVIDRQQRQNENKDKKEECMKQDGFFNEQKVIFQRNYNTEDGMIKRSEEFLENKSTSMDKDVSNQNSSHLNQNIFFQEDSNFPEKSLNPAKILIKIPKQHDE